MNRLRCTHWQGLGTQRLFWSWNADYQSIWMDNNLQTNTFYRNQRANWQVPSFRQKSNHHRTVECTKPTSVQTRWLTRKLLLSPTSHHKTTKKKKHTLLLNTLMSWLEEVAGNQSTLNSTPKPTRNRAGKPPLHFVNYVCSVLDNTATVLAALSIWRGNNCMLSRALLGMVRSHFKLCYTPRLQISKQKGRVLTDPPQRELVEHQERNASSCSNSHSLVSLNTALQNQSTQRSSHK